MEYDILDIEVKKFDDDFYEFRRTVKELERRLGSIIIQGFEDCATVAMAFKLFDSFEGLLEREIIMTDLEKKEVELVREFGADLKEVQKIFEVAKIDPPSRRTRRRSRARSRWVRGPRRAHHAAVRRSSGLNPLVMETDESIEIHAATKRCSRSSARTSRRLLPSGSRRDGEHVGREAQDEPACARTSAGKTPGILRVNFDPMLVKLLREVKYFLLLEMDVPEAAMKTYQRGETLRQQTGNLDLIVVTYNNISPHALAGGASAGSEAAHRDRRRCFRRRSTR